MDIRNFNLSSTESQTYKEVATILSALYNEFLKVGFSRKQAFELVLVAMRSTVE